MLVAHSKFADAVIVLRQLRHRRSLTVGAAGALVLSAAICWSWSESLSDTIQVVIGSFAGLAFVVLVCAAMEWRKYAKVVSQERADGHVRRVSSETRSRLGDLGRLNGFVPSTDEFFELQRVADHAQSAWLGERRDELEAMRRRS